MLPCAVYFCIPIITLIFDWIFREYSMCLLLHQGLPLSSKQLCPSDEVFHVDFDWIKNKTCIINWQWQEKMKYSKPRKFFCFRFKKTHSQKKKLSRLYLSPVNLNIVDSSHFQNKANLRDLIAATGLVILLKLDLNRQFFSPCDLEIWWMTPQKQ